MNENKNVIINENIKIFRDEKEILSSTSSTKNMIKPLVEGFIEIYEDDKQILSKKNAIHTENFSKALAYSMAGDPQGFIAEMHFGNGGSVINGVGAVTYFSPNITGDNANLYNPTYFKNISNISPLNTDKENNNIVIRHERGNFYSDIIITATLDNGEPTGQEAFDDAPNSEGRFIFDEIGLKSFGSNPGQGDLLTHVIFNPIQKSINRKIRIKYTIRINLC